MRLSDVTTIGALRSDGVIDAILSNIRTDSCVKRSEIETIIEKRLAPSSSIHARLRASEMLVNINNWKRVGTEQWRHQRCRKFTEYLVSWVLKEVLSNNNAEVLLLESWVLYAAYESVVIRSGLGHKGDSNDNST